MIMGTGFPPFRGGLMRYADSLGLARVAERLGALAQSVDPRFAPSPQILDLAKKQRHVLRPRRQPGGLT